MIVWQSGDEQAHRVPLVAPGTYHRALAWDVTRCHGEGCSLRETCLRHTELANMRPMTPQVAKMADDPDLCEHGI